MLSIAGRATVDVRTERARACAFAAGAARAGLCASTKGCSKGRARGVASQRLHPDGAAYTVPIELGGADGVVVGRGGLGLASSTDLGWLSSSTWLDVCSSNHVSSAAGSVWPPPVRPGRLGRLPPPRRISAVWLGTGRCTGCEPLSRVVCTGSQVRAPHTQHAHAGGVRRPRSTPSRCTAIACAYGDAHLIPGVLEHLYIPNPPKEGDACAHICVFLLFGTAIVL
jgi:hypothetical protein